MFAYLICFSARGGFLALRALDNIAGQSISTLGKIGMVSHHEFVSKVDV
jgi:hypothetical protein